MLNKTTWKQKMAMYRRSPGSFVIFLLVWLCAIITAGAFVMLIGHILIKGVMYLQPSLFAFDYTSDNCSMMPAIINTLTMTLLSLVIAVPPGIFAAIYLVEYAKRGNKLTPIVRITAETLTGIPSIVYGLFGSLFFVKALKWGLSMLSGASAMAIMILPVVMRTTEEALISVPDAYREGAFGLGAGKLRCVFRIVLPSAIPGILSGVILSIGRIVGETAAIYYTAGTMPQIPANIFGSGRTLAVHMYILASEGLHMNEAYATAVVLLIVVILINFISGQIAKRISKG